MLEKLITGRFIDLNLKMLNSRPAGLSPAAGNPPHGSFVNSTLMPLNIQQSVSDGIFSRTRSSGLGQGVNNAKVHRNFHWLKWIPPYISQIPLGGVDVFTGPMSGCWVITY